MNQIKCGEAVALEKAGIKKCLKSMLQHAMIFTISLAMAEFSCAFYETGMLHSAMFHVTSLEKVTKWYKYDLQGVMVLTNH